MKKILLSIISMIFIIGLGACNKEYVCQCTFPDSNKNFEVKIEKMRKNDAKTVCYDYDLFVGNCKIK